MLVFGVRTVSILDCYSLFCRAASISYFIEYNNDYLIADALLGMVNISRDFSSYRILIPLNSPTKDGIFFYFFWLIFRFLNF